MGQTFGELGVMGGFMEAWRLTKIVLVVMALMSALLGILDFVFSNNRDCRPGITTLVTPGQSSGIVEQ